MPIEDAGFFEQDEPEFDLGFSIAPGDQVSDQLESVVATVNYLQDRIDGSARAQVATVQTGQNMLANKIRMSATEVMESPTETVAGFQQTMAIDAAGKMADVSERFNGIISAIAADDFFSSRCIRRCWTGYRECTANVPHGDPRLLHCHTLLETCLLRCRGTLPDKEIIPPGMPPRPEGFPDIDVLDDKPKPERWMETIEPTGFPTQPPQPQPAPQPPPSPVPGIGPPAPGVIPGSADVCPLPVPFGFPGWSGADGLYDENGIWLGPFNSNLPAGTDVWNRCGVSLGTVGGKPDCVIPTDPTVEMSSTGTTADPRVCGWENLEQYGTVQLDGTTFYVIPGRAVDLGGPNTPKLPESRGFNGFAGEGSLQYPPDIVFQDNQGNPLPPPPNMIQLLWPTQSDTGITIPGYGERYVKMASIPVCTFTGCPDEIPAPEVPPPTPEQPYCIPICAPACPSEDVPDTPEPDQVPCRLWLDCEKNEVYTVQSEDEEPRNPEDILLGSGSVPVGIINTKCDEDPEDEDDDDTPLGKGPSSASLTGCDFLPTAWVFDESTQTATYKICIALGLLKEDGTIPVRSTGVTDITGNAKDLVVWILGGLCKSIDHIVRMFYRFPGDCASATMSSLETTRVFWNILSMITGTAFENAEIRAKQQYDFCAPAKIPPVESAVDAYLADGINRATAECWVRGNDYIWENYERILHARRSKLGVHELIQLLLRKEIDAGEYAKRVRELGFTDQEAAGEFKELSKWVPGPQDLIRWMVRDVEDMNIVNTFGLDTDFDGVPSATNHPKFLGKVEEYSEWQNIDKEDMRRMWRAHWDIPGPHQLFEMMHRNRPGRVPVAIETTDTNVELALQQQDIAPYWVKRLMNVSFHPLSRVDIRRAFRIGAINRTDVIEGYKDLGYNDANSIILADFAEQLVLNGWLRSKWIAKLASGELAEAEFNTLLSQEGADAQYVTEARNRAHLLRKADTRKKCLAALREQYFEGAFTDAEAITAVTNLGVDGTTAVDLVEAWSCELRNKSKPVGAATLCTWWTEGVINGDQFHARLRNLGYSEADADNIVEVCEAKYERKLEAAEKARIRKAEAERKRQEKSDKGRQSSEDREAKRLERMREKARKVRQRREDLLVESAKRLTNRLKIDIVQTLREVRVTYRNSKNSRLWHEADIIVAIVQASQLKTVDSLPSYTQAVVQILNELPIEAVGEHEPE